MTNYIWITTQKEFFHKYPSAPNNVGFLKNLHRHLGKFKIYIEVIENDREIEFFQFQRFINSLLNDIDFDMSCENICNQLSINIKEMYPHRKFMIELSEDGENGVLMEY